MIPRFIPVRFSLFVLPAALGAAGLALGACASGPGPTGSASSSEAAASDTAQEDVIRASSATLVVSGLSCPMCATNIDQQMGRIPGVKSARVDLSQGHVLLGLNPEADVTRSRLARAIEDSGFTLREIIAPSPRGGK